MHDGEKIVKVNIEDQMKSAYIDYEQGNFGEARATLQQVLEQHPNASAASLARQRLDRMDREGR